MARKLLASLILLSSVATAASADEIEAKRMPWADREVTTVEKIQMQEPAELKEFDLGREQPAPWMEEAAKKMKSQGEIGKAISDSEEIQESLIVFISEGMPEGALRTLFRQAAAMPKGSVRFVMRGFEPQKLGNTISRLRNLTDDPQADLVAIDIDPPLFREYGVQAVPVYLVKENDAWFEVKGTISLQGAIENVAKKGNLVVGQLYDIKEPDLLAIIEERGRNYDWNSAIQRAQSRLAQNLSPIFDLPAVSEDDVDFHVPIFTVPHDIVIPEYKNEPEKLVARGGSTINLLEVTSLQVPIIVIDGTAESNLDQMDVWLKAHPNADVFIVGNAVQKENKPLSLFLSEKIGRPVYPWVGRMTDRFGVRAVPALVTQEGKRFKITYRRARASGQEQ